MTESYNFFERRRVAGEERLLSKLPHELHPEALRAKLATPEFLDAFCAQEHALKVIRIQEDEERNAVGEYLGKRAFLHRHTASRKRDRSSGYLTEIGR
jgi:hypothetical protein